MVLAGGQGRRLRPFTDDAPKPLMTLGGTPILEIILRQLRGAGFEHVMLLLGHRADMIRDQFGDGCALGMTLDYSVESEPLGTAGP